MAEDPTINAVAAVTGKEFPVTDQTTDEHDVIVYGPVEEGESTVSGDRYPMSGYGWNCSCSAAGFGYQSADLAAHYANNHLEREGVR